MPSEISTKARERFEAKVYRIPGGCHIWCGASNSGGYGSFSLDGRTETAHRVAWRLYRGPIPTGLDVTHNCPGGDDRACVNDEHLCPGTRAQNNRDIARKNRGSKGRLPYGVKRAHLSTKFEAQVKSNGKKLHLGTFKTVEEAHAVALKKKRQLLGLAL